mgnify:CR=1 FL=1
MSSRQRQASELAAAAAAYAEADALVQRARTLAPDDFMRGSLRCKPSADVNHSRGGLQRVWMSHTLNDDLLDERSQH